MHGIKRFLLSPSKNNQRFLVLFFALVGFISPMIFGYLNGFPVPHYHDEFSYLLGADTFAHGHLSNPTPEFSEHFEAPHVLVKPVYMSKYPPMQGLFLALGQVIFGHPIFGVWISCGLAAAALFWMLSIWSRPKWAFLGTVLMIYFVGIDYYWAQSYWGGMVAFAGGTLFFGGFRRITKWQSLVSSTLIMTLGGIILVNSRPFEGTVTMIPALLLLLVQVLRKTRISYPQKLAQIILPGIIVAGISLSAMGYFNYQITGNALKFPYTEHQSHYFSTPLFIFQKPGETEGLGTPRLQELYKSLNCSDLIRHLDEYRLPNIKQLFPVYAFVFLLSILSYALLYPTLTFFLLISVFFLLRKSRWMNFVFITIIFALFCISFATYWDFTHYVAPLGCCFYLLTIQGFRYFWFLGKKANKRNLIGFLLLTLAISSMLYKKLYPYEWIFPTTQRVVRQDFSSTDLNLAEPQTITIATTATQIRQFIEEKAEKESQEYLILVNYDEDFTYLDEIVFNKSDLKNSRIIWAIDLGKEKNAALVDFYKDRKALLVSLKDRKLTVSPYPTDFSQNTNE